MSSIHFKECRRYGAQTVSITQYSRGDNSKPKTLRVVVLVLDMPRVPSVQSYLVSSTCLYRCWRFLLPNIVRGETVAPRVGVFCWCFFFPRHLFSSSCAILSRIINTSERVLGYFFFFFFFLYAACLFNLMNNSTSIINIYLSIYLSPCTDICPYGHPRHMRAIEQDKVEKSLKMK